MAKSKGAKSAKGARSAKGALVAKAAKGAKGAKGAKKFVYFFGNGKADGNRSMKDTLGGKGAGLAEMTNAGLPVPAGFTISTDACNIYYANNSKLPANIETEMVASCASSRRRPARSLARSSSRSSCRSAPARSFRCPA